MEGASGQLLKVRQGSLEHELFVPEAHWYLVEDLTSLITDADWVHMSKFTISEELMAKALLALKMATNTSGRSFFRCRALQ